MPAPVAVIHDVGLSTSKMWMSGTSPCLPIVERRGSGLGRADEVRWLRTRRRPRIARRRPPRQWLVPGKLKCATVRNWPGAALLGLPASCHSNFAIRPIAAVRPGSSGNGQRPAHPAAGRHARCPNANCAPCVDSDEPSKRAASRHTLGARPRDCTAGRRVPSAGRTVCTRRRVRVQPRLNRASGAPTICR
jgi:hypothetical protein